MLYKYQSRMKGMRLGEATFSSEGAAHSLRLQASSVVVVEERREKTRAHTDEAGYRVQASKMFQ